jgi:hypothetical protein
MILIFSKSNEDSADNDKVTNEIIRCKEIKNSFQKNLLNDSHIQELQFNVNNLTKINLSNTNLKTIDPTTFRGFF